MEKDLPKITFGINVLNGEPFTKCCLRSLYPFAHEIIVVEGGSRWAIDQAPEGHSVDGTLEALYEFKEQEDPDDKLQIVRRDGFWIEKDEQCQAYAERATGDYLWAVAIDEFYKPEDIHRILCMLGEDPSITAVSFMQLPFWGSFHSTLHGWHSWGNVYEFHRLFKFGHGYKMVDSRPGTVVDDLGRDTRSVHWIRGHALAKQGIFMYHYAFVFPRQVRDKTWYHWRRSPGSHIRYREWYENNYQQITQPLRIYHDQSRPSWLRRFTGEHPPQIAALISDIESGKISVERRREDDINRLLASPTYRAKTSILEALSAPAGFVVQGIAQHVRRARAWLGRLKRIGKLFAIDLPRLAVHKLKGESALWWSHEYQLVVHSSGILSNVNQVLSASRPRRALLVYIVRPFIVDPRSQEFVAHVNYWRSIELAKMLNELGYVVDVMDYNDHYSPVTRDYDLLIGFGRADELAKQLPQRSIKLFLGTGSEANFQNRREKERVEEVNRRRSCNLGPVRLTPYTCSENFRYYDALVCLGNATTAATYRPFFDKEIYFSNNHGYDRWMGLPEGKDFKESKRSFLYFAGSGQVLTGLDLLLEVFASKPHLSLYVCGPFEKEKRFVECFRKELYETQNIFPVGQVSVGSSEYFELVRKCGMVIFPICAGGGPGGVTVCMGNGLIPVVTKEAGIDTDDFGITLPSYKIEDIAAAVDWISSQPAEWHEGTSHKVLEAARRNFSQAAFTRRFREILTEVISNPPQGP